MSTQKKILAFAKKQDSLTTQDLVRSLGLARQSISAHLKALVDRGMLIRIGSTRSARYRLASKKGVPPRSRRLVLHKRVKGLEEDRVLKEIERKLGLSRLLNKNALTIFSYAFTEMLNNAIDHSASVKVVIRVACEQGTISFEVRDFGVGIFYKIKREFRLPDEFVALEHVLKGKQTTAPEAHSGEGIFFTSRIADVFCLRSHKLKVKIDNREPDTFVSEEKSILGTNVEFGISQNTKKRLEPLFARYTNKNFDFDRSDQRIQISNFGGAISRSEAKRLLLGLDKFKRVTLDFRGVKTIGQGFADEVFRVYAKSNPEKVIEWTNANAAIQFMIRRAKKLD